MRHIINIYDLIYVEISVLNGNSHINNNIPNKEFIYIFSPYYNISLMFFLAVNRQPDGAANVHISCMCQR